MSAGRRQTVPFALGAYFTGSATNGDAWRAPEEDIDADVEFERYRSYVASLERAGFHAIFLYDNVLPIADPTTLVRTPALARWDTFTLLAALAVTTTHIGLIGTASTTFNEPYNIARKVASLDRLSRGRAGWNVVTATGGGENFNLAAHMDHGARYERAHEFVDVVKGLWDSVDPLAFIRDKSSGVWLDPGKVHPLNHVGRFYQVAGPLNAPPPVQRPPVLAQAGASGPGKDLAARIGEVIYTAACDPDEARAYRLDVLDRAGRHGRDERHMRFLPGLAPIVASTESEARAKFERYLSYLDHDETLQAISSYSSLSQDLSLWPRHTPITLGAVAETNSHKSRQSLIVDWIERYRPTPDDILRTFTRGGHRLVVGTPSAIVDDMQGWYESGACDGFNIMFTSSPVGIDDFTRLVVPELRRRGLLQDGYGSRILRENLRIPSGRANDR
ncbi:monooxygenase-like protein [Ameyamaea chiangmaiensis NBRC 103196]|uniref:NtaA/DmoA family FMN-dependent monooxygenase n=1 Tax=Ameyamaea chiangmaiensis TaxID=442969 RepID=A0A850P9Q2_9PROT|nr:NtaA/DmoA family FMN-dependent monooxygenase [Ameyamaea chiangmaiensis]MBS4074932.1 NtaA/DmoA family FMN-dependent monooxygenase [Ameyamaea chiangmaiensis]NVN41325.1 NtaA/DmoA family FMN-dependent monooxygenase [Ameyamaea chiangmaiensis]GBQ63244.1 monooxygenase-like protein [Ameyamaea chiangmaiensis NBRC 103196]